MVALPKIMFTVSRDPISMLEDVAKSLKCTALRKVQRIRNGRKRSFDVECLVARVKPEDRCNNCEAKWHINKATGILDNDSEHN